MSGEAEVVRVVEPAGDGEGKPPRAGSLVPAPSPSDDGGDPLRVAARALAASGYFKDAKTISQAYTKALRGRELGIGPVAAQEGLFFVRDKLCMSANLMAAVVKASKKYNYRVKEITNTRVVLLFLERSPDGRGWEEIGESVFTIEDAKAAGLDKGDNWRKYPRNMLFARALSNGVKWFTPDAFSSPVYLPDEIPGSGLDVDGDSLEVVRKPPAALPPAEPDKLAAELAALPQEQREAYLELFGVDQISELSSEQRRHIKVLLESVK